MNFKSPAIKTAILPKLEQKIARLLSKCGVVCLFVCVSKDKFTQIDSYKNVGQ